MEKFQSIKILPIPFKKQIRLYEIELFIKSIIQLVKQGYLAQEEAVCLFEILLEYKNVHGKVEFNSFMEQAGISDKSVMVKRSELFVPDIYIDFNLYKFFYFDFWFQYLTEFISAEIQNEIIEFSVEITKDFVYRTYSPTKEGVNKFKKEIAALFYGNGIEFSSEEGEELYTFKITNEI